MLPSGACTSSDPKSMSTAEGHVRYQFGQAFGGVLFPPYSEAFGRKSVYISASLLYCISCLVIGVVHSVPAAVIGRFVSGFMSAVPSIIVSGSIEDMYDVSQRVWLMYAWACATTLGLLVGPIYGSYIAITLGWCVHPSLLTTVLTTNILQEMGLPHRRHHDRMLHSPPVLHQRVSPITTPRVSLSHPTRANRSHSFQDQQSRSHAFFRHLHKSCSAPPYPSILHRAYRLRRKHHERNRLGAHLPLHRSHSRNLLRLRSITGTIIFTLSRHGRRLGLRYFLSIA